MNVTNTFHRYILTFIVFLEFGKLRPIEIIGRLLRSYQLFQALCIVVVFLVILVLLKFVSEAHPYIQINFI